MIYAWIALGGAIGSVVRALASSLGPSPWATVGINAAGSFLIGALAAMGGRLGPEMRAFLMVGLCGGFTTFSAFSLQTVELLQEGRGGLALANVLASVTLCLGATALGWQVGRG